MSTETETERQSIPLDQPQNKETDTKNMMCNALTNQTAAHNSQNQLVNNIF